MSWLDGLTESEADGIEYKAMASGLDKIDQDYVYFKLNNLFGLAVFHKMKVASAAERGARFTSSGFMSASFTKLYQHMDFLRSQSEHINKNPGDFTQMKAKIDLIRKAKLPSPVGDLLIPEYAETERKYIYID